MIDLNDPPAVLVLDNRDGGGDGDDNNCSMSEEAIQNFCVGTHRCEECNLPSYAKAIGVVSGRRCFVCQVRFVDGKDYPEGENTWKVGEGGAMRAHHCMNCSICVCNTHRLGLDLQSPPRRRRFAISSP